MSNLLFLTEQKKKKKKTQKQKGEKEVEEKTMLDLLSQHYVQYMY